MQITILVEPRSEVGTCAITVGGIRNRVDEAKEKLKCRNVVFAIIRRLDGNDEIVVDKFREENAILRKILFEWVFHGERTS